MAHTRRVIAKHAIGDEKEIGTLIVEETFNKVKDCNVIPCVDTDVFIAIFCHANSKGNGIIVTTKPGFVSVGNITLEKSDDLKNSLLLVHAISGCDTVSATFSLGKLKACRELKESANWQKLM